jgi:hypothetical protein
MGESSVLTEAERARFEASRRDESTSAAEREDHFYIDDAYLKAERDLKIDAIDPTAFKNYAPSVIEEDALIVSHFKDMDEKRMTIRN